MQKTCSFIWLRGKSSTWDFIPSFALWWDLHTISLLVFGWYSVSLRGCNVGIEEYYDIFKWSFSTYCEKNQQDLLQKAHLHCFLHLVAFSVARISAGVHAEVLVYHTFAITLFAKIHAKAVICILWDPKLTRSGDLAYLYVSILAFWPCNSWLLKGLLIPLIGVNL